jgi:hypothetical protein
MIVALNMIPPWGWLIAGCCTLYAILQRLAGG